MRTLSQDAETAIKQLRRGRSDPLVECAVCGRYKAPVGRSTPMGGPTYCEMECAGHAKEPHASSYWPGERDRGYAELIEKLLPSWSDEPDGAGFYWVVWESTGEVDMALYDSSADHFYVSGKTESPLCFTRFAGPIPELEMPA